MMRHGAFKVFLYLIGQDIVKGMGRPPPLKVRAMNPRRAFSTFTSSNLRACRKTLTWGLAKVISLSQRQAGLVIRLSPVRVSRSARSSYQPPARVLIFPP